MIVQEWQPAESHYPSLIISVDRTYSEDDRGEQWVLVKVRAAVGTSSSRMGLMCGNI
jgi:hypothetical protein